MPTYEYHCTLCHHRFEAFQKMSDAPIAACPQCDGPVQRLMGAGMGLIFKGSGFYITDYKKNNSSMTSSSPPPASGESNQSKESAGSKANESKPADSKPAVSSADKTKSDKAAA
ncbi:zinc ribbon domain-containing protein [bacterium]|nr:zinc ribbon domain-containing protein [bacterium]